MPCSYIVLVPSSLYRCIGAKLRILLHCLFRSSFPTTPFNRVPIGSPPLFMSTHALSSKLTTLPSARWYFFLVRTTTACLMSPLRTLFAADTDTEPPGPDSGPKFRCFCTTTMMRSPVGKDPMLERGIRRGGGVERAYSRMAFHFEHLDAFDNSCAGVVDRIEHGLLVLCSISMRLLPVCPR